METLVSDPTAGSGRNWSAQQRDIFGWFAAGEGNLVVRARAGTGKTTTIVEGIEHAYDGSILLAAFNKRIAEELAQRLHNPAAIAMTLHSAGLRVVKRFWEHIAIAQRSERADDLARRAAGEQAPDAILRLVGKLCSLGREMNPFAASGEDLAEIAWSHDCTPGEEWEDHGWGERQVCDAAYRAMVLAKERPTITGIDFADMLYLPLVNGWVRPAYDLVVIDEAQDLNVAQLELARRLARNRVCVVGDDAQAIYAFRGADSGSLDRLKRELSAIECGLTTTYRCAKLIVEAAREVVPDFYAAESNPDGVVRQIAEAKLLDEIKPGDAVLSRINAPLVSLCLRALKAGVPARIEGRDIAASLRSLIKELATGRAKSSIPAFLDKLAKWKEREIARAFKSGRGGEARAEAVRDRAAAVLALSEGVSGISELKARLESIFSELSANRCVVFSSVHKAKGLEWDRVFILHKTLREHSDEENNIRYVAITRARSVLVWVGEAAAPSDRATERAALADKALCAPEPVADLRTGGDR